MSLREYIEPWLVDNFEKNGFLYDEKWGGIVCKSGSSYPLADYGFGRYNNHHFTLGYFVFSIAVLAKFDDEWGMKFKDHAYALVASYMSLGKNKAKSKYTKIRSFDPYKLHSWTNCLHDNHPRHSEIPSVSINAYYSASLLGMVYGDDHLVTVGSTLASFEIEAVKTWWHVKEGGVYEGEFSKKNKMVLPITPVLSEILFSDVGFVRDVVEWALPSLARKEATDGWKGFVYALEAIYDHKNALKKIRDLKGFHEGNSLSNMLWWVHSMTGKKNVRSWCKKEANDCWFCTYCC
ncbi:endo-1,3(4)-beta-glucanase 1-like [Chenopodium quinoa]|nr:endo-1,3(4)-beta-glucanase 1-like [Chenopodium quinoa]